MKFFKSKKNNIIHVKSVDLNLDSSNKNDIIIISQPGSGKTKYIVRPNLKTKNSSYIVLNNDNLYETYAEEFNKNNKKIENIKYIIQK